MGNQIKLNSLRELIGILSRQLNIRITFFNADGIEMADEESIPISGYCRRQRKRSRAFNQRCVFCDKSHLEQAKATKKEMVYLCHAGLLEGVFPLYSRVGLYLGSIFFGQLVPENTLPPAPGMAFGNIAKMREIARVLQIAGEHIIQQEMVSMNRYYWSERIHEYICNNFKSRVTLKKLAALIGCSVSYLSHHFTLEFGLPLRQYINEYRLGIAKQKLDEGLLVKEAAVFADFSDEFHFSKKFKKKFGVTPSSVRKKKRVSASQESNTRQKIGGG